MTRPTPHDNPDTNLHQRIWRSIFPIPLGTHGEANRKRFYRSNLLLHFRPPTVKERTLRFTLTWGLGGMAATLVLLLMATGILLKFVYIPTPVEAYASVNLIVSQIPFGRLIRNIHHWSANFLVVVLLLHMLRIFFTGAFHPPRQFNLVVGLFLFGLVLTANLSGYLLPYDQLAYWAVTVIAAMVGYLPFIGDWVLQVLGLGTDMSPGTLSIFFTMHTAAIPVLLTCFMAFHFWRIRKAGGVVVPRKPGEQIEKNPSKVPVIPHLLVREMATALTVTAVILLFSISFDAPLSSPANPGLSPTVVRAPWYFAGLQELLLHIHPSVAVSLVPLLAGFFFLSIPYFAYKEETEGIWFASKRGKKQTVVTAITSLTLAPVLVVLDTKVPKTTDRWLPMPPIVHNGLIPLLFFLILITVAILTLRIKGKCTTGETIQCLFVFLVTGFIALTIVSVFFRGPSMQLIWPF